MYVGETSFNDKNVRLASIMTFGAPIFMLSVMDFLLDGKTTAISKSPFYAWKILNMMKSDSWS